MAREYPPVFQGPISPGDNFIMYLNHSGHWEQREAEVRQVSWLHGEVVVRIEGTDAIETWQTYRFRKVSERNFMRTDK